MSIHLPRLTPETVDQLSQGLAVCKCNNWSVLKASGPKLREYLQGQITQDIGKLTNTQGIHSCILTPQGKAVSELYIFEGHNDELILLTPAAYAETTVARLRQFSLGYQLRIGVIETLGICSLQGANAAEILGDLDLSEPDQGWLSTSQKQHDDSFAMVMSENPQAYWIISSDKQIEAIIDRYHTTNEDELEAMRIMRGLPDFGVEWDASTHPLNANLIEFDGVSFDKGCYVGQEVTSRMHWRSGIKKKLYRVIINGTPETLPCPIRSTANIGELKSAAIDQTGQCYGIALLPIEVFESGSTLSL
ncbi:MAG: YgfZ/GcvT domain-containing protein, partial [Mariprofundus sp.]